MVMSVAATCCTYSQHREVTLTLSVYAVRNPFCHAVVVLYITRTWLRPCNPCQDPCLPLHLPPHGIRHIQALFSAK
eukprot:215621-Pelagomonas_calceolata.AAC.1